MKRKLGRWLVGALLGLVLLFAAALLSLDTIAKFAAQRRVEAETGMKTRIGKFSVGMKTPTIHIQNFVLENPEQFGGGTFVDMPELFLEYDPDALRSGKLHLKLVRIDVAKINVVENQDGERNDELLQKHQRKSASHDSKSKADQPFVFDGVDQLDVSLGVVQFTSFKNPAQNLKQDLGIRHELFKQLKTEKDFQTAAALLTLKAGASLLMQGDLTNPITLLLGGAQTGKDTKKVLEGISEPVPANVSTNTP